MNQEKKSMIFMRKQGKILFALLIGCFWFQLPVPAFTQERNEEVTIVAPYQPSISDAFKIGFTPEIRAAEQQTGPFQFNYLEKQMNTKLELDKIDPLKFSISESKDLLRNYIKAGFGNYLTPLLEFHASSLQSDKYMVGGRFRHHSSNGGIKDYGPSSYSHNLASIYAEKYFKQHTLSGDITYSRDVVHFYGYQPDSFPDTEFSKNDIKQRFQLIEANGGFKSNYTNEKKLAHKIKAGFYHFSDLYDSREYSIMFSAGINKNVNLFKNDMRQMLGLDLDLQYLDFKDTLSSFSPFIIKIKPRFELDFDHYSLLVGFDITTQVDSIAWMHAYPLLRGEVSIITDQLKAYAEIRGEMITNSFRSMADENPFMTSNPMIRLTNNRFEISAGLAGNAGGLNYFAEVRNTMLNDLPLFVNDTISLPQNRFDVIYDNVNLFTVKGGIGFQKQQVFNVSLTAAYHLYSTDREIKAWHKPSYEAGLSASYTFLKKYTVDAAFMASGGRYAKTYTNGEARATELKDVLDLNLGFEYRHNKSWSAFLRANNILNQHYQLWNNYPVQGFQAMVGGTYSF